MKANNVYRWIHRGVICQEKVVYMLKSVAGSCDDVIWKNEAEL